MEANYFIFVAVQKTQFDIECQTRKCHTKPPLINKSAHMSVQRNHFHQLILEHFSVNINLFFFVVFFYILQK